MIVFTLIVLPCHDYQSSGFAVYKVNNSAAFTALTHLFITVRSSFIQTFFVWLNVYLESVPNWKRKRLFSSLMG